MTMLGKINTVMYDDFTVLDATSTRVPGITSTGFTRSLYNPSSTEVSGSVIVSIAELGNGDYRLSYTPNVKGLWKVNVFHDTYFPAGKTNSHQIYTADIDSVAEQLTALDVVVDAGFAAGAKTADLATMEELVTEIEADLSTASETAVVVWANATRTLTSTGASITQQEVRDAMKLAPSGGVPVADSIDNKLNQITTSTGHVSDVVDALTSSVATIPTNPMLDTENGSSFTNIPDMAKESTVISAYTSTGNALTTGFNAGAKEATLLEVQTSTGHISSTADDILTQANRLLYQDGIWLNEDDGTDGTVVGENGIQTKPVKTLADALTIAATLGSTYKKLKVTRGWDSEVTLTSSLYLWEIEGTSADYCWLYPNSYWLDTCTLRNMAINGTCGIPGAGSGDWNDIVITDCIVCDVSNLNYVYARNSEFSGTVHFTGLNSPRRSYACFFAFNCCTDPEYYGAGQVTFDFDTDCEEFYGAFNDWTGDVEFTNLQGGEIYFYGEGEITIDATCSGGTFYVAGNMKVTNNASGITIVYKQILRDANGYVFTSTGVIEDKLNALITSTGHISEVVDEIEIDADLIQNISEALSEIPTNPMLDTENGSTFTSIPDMALNSTVAKETTLNTVDDKVDALIVTTDHIHVVVDEIDAILGGIYLGDRTVTISIKDADYGNSLGDASVQLWGTDLTNLVTYGFTDSNGNMIRTVNDGVYKVKVRKNGYQFSDPFDLTITADTSVEYTGTTYIIGPAEDLDLCRLYGYIINGAYVPIEGVSICAVPYDSPTIIETSTSTTVVSPETVEAITTSTGEFAIDLLRNVKFTVSIPEIGFRETVLVPNTSGPITLWSLTDLFVSGDPERNDPNW